AAAEFRVDLEEILNPRRLLRQHRDRRRANQRPCQNHSLHAASWIPKTLGYPCTSRQTSRLCLSIFRALLRSFGTSAPLPACVLLLSSSMAEHPAVNRRVVGSSP